MAEAHNLIKKNITDKFNLSVNVASIILPGTSRKVNLNELSEERLLALTKTNPELISLKVKPTAKPTKKAKATKE